MPVRHVIVGSGPAGMSAAEAIRERDASAEIVVVGVEPEGYYSRPGLAYLLAKEIPESSLYPFTPQDLARLRLVTVAERATGLDAAGHTLSLEDGRTIAYDRLLLATGSRAIPLGVPGAELDGVVKLDDLRDASDLIQRCRSTRKAVVIGGGITALEIVEGLSSRHVHVHYFMRKDRYWGNVLSEEESRIVEDGLRRRGVEVHHFTSAARVVGSGGAVTAIETAEGTRVPCEMVAVAIGVLPCKELAEAAGLECGRGIHVDSFLQSSATDVFAAGDIAEMLDPVSGRRNLEVLWNSAVQKGRVAGRNMVEGPLTPYDGVAPLNVTRLAGFKITIMGTVGTGTDTDIQGVVRGDSETWRQSGHTTTVESQVGPAHLRLSLGNGIIQGAVVMGDQDLSFALQELIGSRVDVSGIADHLTAPGAPLDELLFEAWQDWKGANA